MSTSHSTVGQALFSSSAPSASSLVVLPAPNTPPATLTWTSWTPEPAADDANNSRHTDVHISHLDRHPYRRSPRGHRRGANCRSHASARRPRRPPYPPRPPWLHGPRPRGPLEPRLPHRRVLHGPQLLRYALSPPHRRPPPGSPRHCVAHVHRQCCRRKDLPA